MAIKVHLREKPISGNRIWLFLDFWPGIKDVKTGKKTRRQFLNLYLFAESEYQEQRYTDKSGKEQRRIVPMFTKADNIKVIKLDPLQKEHNLKVRELAEMIRQKKAYELNKPEIYSEYEKEQLRKKEVGESDFLEFFKGLTDKQHGNNYNSWLAVSMYLKDFTGGSLKVAQVNEKFCNDFRSYLMETKGRKNKNGNLTQNSASNYFSKFKAALKRAYRDDLLSVDLSSRVDPIKSTEVKKQYLTIEELNILSKTECLYPVIKQAALFSALTGLRFSDIQKLVWSEIEFIKGKGYYINFTQQKTKGIEHLPISDQAYSLLGERGQSADKVFKGLTYSALHNKYMYFWLGSAGIEKDVSFHAFGILTPFYNLHQGPTFTQSVKCLVTVTYRQLRFTLKFWTRLSATHQTG